ncbi:Protein LAZ 1 [Ananas comosus]|uniref:Protein LAZ 1 n=1 Tax=Ananas comosus TaxID=4615 RepID=A0A199UUH4_ANACO|nr:Protein LAZ 1 [Ananas comosus]
MSDYASLGAPDPEEVRESGRLTKMHLVQPDDRERRLSFPQSVHDVTVDDVRYTVGPMERGIARINRTLHQISENMRQIENR